MKLQQLLEKDGLLAALFFAWTPKQMRKITGDDLARKMACLITLSSVIQYISSNRTEDLEEVPLMSEEIVFCLMASLEQAFLNSANPEMSTSSKAQTNAFIQSIMFYFHKALTLTPNMITKASLNHLNRGDQYMFHNHTLIQELWDIICGRSKTTLDPSTRICLISFTAAFIERGHRMLPEDEQLLRNAIKSYLTIALRSSSEDRSLEGWLKQSKLLLCISQMLSELNFTHTYIHTRTYIHTYTVCTYLFIHLKVDFFL